MIVPQTTIEHDVCPFCGSWAIRVDLIDTEDGRCIETRCERCVEEYAT